MKWRQMHYPTGVTVIVLVGKLGYSLKFNAVQITTVFLTSLKLHALHLKASQLVQDSAIIFIYPGESISLSEGTQNSLSLIVLISF